MAAHRYSPTVRRRRLSAELRRIRSAARITLEEAAKRAEIPKSTLGNIESGAKQRPQLAEVRAILDACKVTDEREREEILELCRQSRERGWWARYRDVLPGRYVGFEMEASVISTWEPLMVPGLLQIPEYIEVTARAALAQPHDVQRVIDSRIERQRILTDDPPELWAIFDEGVLLRLRQYPEVMTAQIAHILELAEDDNTVTIQMTRADQLNAGSAGPFVITEFPNRVDPTVVHLETDTDGLYLEEAEEVARYRRLFNHLRLGALRPGETIARLRELTDQT
ncbi:helix-turn-helix domain-containing protein [Nocardiopsis sp. CNT-189]|uniref:helix-turn-helix domain-containing protein n=1 Tax=Nocardiopsis oceanisediminis TaxID=2816862 RepID=UPI003B2FF6FA